MMSAWTTHLDPALLVKFTVIGFSVEDAEVAVHVIEDALREDSPAGDALRERLGLRLDISRIWVSQDGRTTSTAPLSGTTPQETRSLYDTSRTTRRLP